MITNDPNLPTWLSPAYLEMLPKWRRCRDVRGATDTLRAKRSEYLPKFDVESAKDWDVRVMMTVVVDWFEQAITTFVGLGLGHDPELGATTPPEIVADWENLDGEGNHGAVVAQYALDQALTDGHMVLLTDYPVVSRSLTKLEEIDQDICPYVVRIPIDRILSWRVSTLGAAQVVTQVVFEEPTMINEGAFGSTSLMQYRVFRLRDTGTTTEVAWEKWRTLEKETVRIAEGVLRGPKRIPMAVVYGGQQDGLLRSRPPFDGLAHSNLRWAQLMSDRTASLHRCGIPIPVIIGQFALDPLTGKPPADVKMSSSHPLQIDQGGDFKIVEAQGTALEQTRLDLQDWEKRIAAQSLAMLQRDTANADTATAHRMNRGREESKLGRALRSLEDALELSLQFMCDYRGLDRELIDVTVRRDYGDVVNPVTLELLSQLQLRGQLTMTRLLRELQRASMFSRDFNVENETADLETDAKEADTTTADQAAINAKKTGTLSQ